MAASLPISMCTEEVQTVSTASRRSSRHAGDIYNVNQYSGTNTPWRILCTSYPIALGRPAHAAGAQLAQTGSQPGRLRGTQAAPSSGQRCFFRGYETLKRGLPQPNKSCASDASGGHRAAASLTAVAPSVQHAQF